MPTNSPGDVQYKFNELDKRLQGELDITAQGANVIRLIYPPEEEKYYLNRLKQDYPDEALINVGKLFVEMIDSYGLDEFIDIFKHYRSEPEKVFQSRSDYDPDLSDIILEAIDKAEKEGKIPFLIRIGALYGTGIRLNKVIKSQIVSNLNHPLVIFYPARETEGDPLFLNIRRTSDYLGETI